MKRFRNYFSPGEWLLWAVSVGLILFSFLIFDRENLLTLVASLIGVTSLIFNAKGNPIGQVLMILFSLLYGWISWTFAYYGEMITYLGMTLPMAVVALISWLKNPYKGNRSQVAASHLKTMEYVWMLAAAAAVTVVFYFILRFFRTANLLISTFSVTTSFIAAYLTFRRSPYFASSYAANDMVLIVMWLMAAREDPSYFSVAVCFALFLVNDLYGFVCWIRMRRAQSAKI